MKKLLLTLATVGAITALVGVYAMAPDRAMKEIEEGFKSKNANQIANHVDFEKLRANIKEQLMLKMAEDAKKSNNKFAGAMMASIGEKMVDGILNSYLTNTGLKQALEDNKKKKLFEGITYDGEFVDADTYAVELTNEKGKKIPVTLKRYGLFDWKVVEMALPKE